MKALIIADRKRYEKFMPDTPFVRELEKVFMPLGTPDAELLQAGGDADFLAADAIAKVSAELIDGMPNLKVIHSEGVAYNGIDCAAAAARGIPVCNNAGINAQAVAEHAVMLMLMLQRSAIAGNEAVLAGKQIGMKTSMMGQIPELGDCTVGLIGFGNIARETAKRLNAFGCKVAYYASHRRDAETEAKLGVTYMTPDEMKKECDIISIHVPVTPETTGMVDREFLRGMKKAALLINTARGEIVDNEALKEALTEGWIAGAGLDTVSPEPVPADHVLLHLPEEAARRIVFSPHIAGVTRSTFRRGHANIWTAFETVAAGGRPANIVNGI